jgi:protein-S-isoprenylcysteine O-methyltransferase Ste14
MNQKTIVIVGFSYLYAFFEVFLNVRQRSKGKIASSGDRGSLWVLYGLITLGYALSFGIGATRTGRLHDWNTFFALGAVLVVIGLFIRIQSILTLRQFFTYSVARVESHQIIETGLYKSIRHPGYVGQLLIFLGTAMSLSNWLSILSMMIPVAVGYAYRIQVEERFMLEQYGEAYQAHRRRTKKIIPRLY